MSAARALRLAASVDRVSAHVLGEALVSAATEAGLQLTLPTEGPRAARPRDRGHTRRSSRPRRKPGVPARRRRAAHGDRLQLPEHDPWVRRSARLVAVDGDVAGVIVMADELQPDAEDIVERPRRGRAARRDALRRPPLSRRARGPRARSRPRLRRVVPRTQARGRAPGARRSKPESCDHGRRRHQRRPRARARRSRDRDGSGRREVCPAIVVAQFEDDYVLQESCPAQRNATCVPLGKPAEELVDAPRGP